MKLGTVARIPTIVLVITEPSTKTPMIMEAMLSKDKI